MALASLVVGCDSFTPVAGEPAALRILVLECEYEDRAKDGEGRDPQLKRLLEGLSSEVVEKLGSEWFDAAFEVRGRTKDKDVDGEFVDPELEDVDIIIQPVLVEPGAVRQSVNWLGFCGGTLAFATTWFGAYFIPGFQYSFGEKFQVKFEISLGGEPGMPFLAHKVAPDPVPLWFYDRNDLLSWYSAATLLAPPQWICGDDDEGIVPALRAGLAESVAGKLTVFLKGDFEEEALQQGAGTMALTAAVTEDSEVRVTGVLRSRRVPIDRVIAMPEWGWEASVVLYLEDQPGPSAENQPKQTVEEWMSIDGRSHGDQKTEGGVHFLYIDKLLKLVPGKPLSSVRIQARSDRTFTRTLAVPAQK